MQSDDIKSDRKMKEKSRDTKKKSWKKTESFLKAASTDSGNSSGPVKFQN